MMGAVGVPIFFLLSRFWSLSITGSLQYQDMGVVNKPVGDRRGNSGAIKEFTPVAKRQVGSNNRWFYLMPLADDLEEQIWSLLTKR